jgi:D-sedoheptulose 7-phosphate isomerase
MRDVIRKQLKDSYKLKKQIAKDDKYIDQISQFALLLIKAYQSGHKVLIAGNGGSAADAQHMAAELVGRFTLNRAALPAVALTTDTSIITAMANDFGFDEIYSRQIDALGLPGDVFIALSTSGNSSNILKAIDHAKKKKILVLGFTGESGGKMASGCDLCFRVPSTDTPRIQEAHAMIIHILCSLVEQTLFGSAPKKA